jgi:hypothetical protein
MAPPIEEWFWRWRKTHTRLVPHGQWEADGYSPRTEDGRGFYLGWMEEFERAGITEEVATEASRKLQREPNPGYPEHHLAPLLRIAGGIVREQQQQQEIEARREAIRADRERREWVARAAGRWDELDEETRRRRMDKARRATRETSETLAEKDAWVKKIALLMLAEDLQKADAQGLITPSTPPRRRPRQTETPIPR